MNRRAILARLQARFDTQDGRVDLAAERQARAELTDAMTAIIDKAETDGGRDLTRDESREFDSLREQGDQVTATIDTELDRRERQDAALGRAGATAAAHGAIFRRDDGTVVRGLVHGESAARLWGGHIGAGERNGPDQASDVPNALGRMILARVTGRGDLVADLERDMTSASGPGGGFWFTEELSRQLIDLARAQLVLSRAGAVTVPLNAGATTFVTVDEDPVAVWHEELDTIPHGDVKIGSLLMKGHTLVSLIRLGHELIEDSGEAAAAQVETIMGRAIAAQLDRAMFRGHPNLAGGLLTVGISDYPGVGVVDMAGVNPTDYAPWLDAVQLVEEANVVPSVRIDSPRTKRQLGGLVETTTGQPLRAPDAVAELTHISSTTVPTNLGTGTDDSLSVVGEFGMAGAMVLVGVREGFRVATTDVGDENFERLGVSIRIHGRFDLAIARPVGLTRVAAIGPTP